MAQSSSMITIMPIQNPARPARTSDDCSRGKGTSHTIRPTMIRIVLELIGRIARQSFDAKWCSTWRMRTVDDYCPSNRSSLCRVDKCPLLYATIIVLVAHTFKSELACCVYIVCGSFAYYECVYVCFLFCIFFSPKQTVLSLFLILSGPFLERALGLTFPDGRQHVWKN